MNERKKSPISLKYMEEFLMTTALIYDPIFLEHITPADHPERPERLQRAIEILEALNWMEREGLVHLAPRAASEE